MSQISIKQIPDNSKLQYLGNLFLDTRLNNGWRVGTYFQGDGLSQPSHLDVSMLPVLGLRRVFTQTSGQQPFKQSGFSKRWVFPDRQAWQRVPLSTWPALSGVWKSNEVGTQLCFRFVAGGITIWLPTIELARSLFFTSAYLTRAALTPNGLDMLFRVMYSDRLGTSRVEAIAGNTVPVHEWDRAAYRAHLAWLLLNPDNKQAFESIYAHQVRECVRHDHYLRWAFNLDPPPLAGCEVSARGWLDEQTNSYLVFELTGFGNLPQPHIANVEFLHPNVKERVSAGRQSGGIGSKLATDDIDLEVDSEEAPTSDKSHAIIEVNPTLLRFAHEIKTRRIYAGKRNTPGAKSDADLADGNANRGFGVQEGAAGGELAPAEWDTLQMEESQNVFRSKFLELQRLIDALARIPELTLIHKKVAPLPEVARCSLHRMADDTPRCYLHAVFKRKDGSNRHILEIDTSDGSRMLASKVLGFKESMNRQENLIRIVNTATKQSIRWRNATISACCNLNKSIVHPMYARGDLTEEAFENWQKRFVAALVI